MKYPKLEVMYDDSILERTEYYAKVQPILELRDIIHKLHATSAIRIELSMDSTIQLLEYIYQGFSCDPEEVYRKKENINRKRDLALFMSILCLGFNTLGPI